VADSTEIAAWLIAKRLTIERTMADRLGSATPAPGSAEVETLRRFRSYAVVSLRRSERLEPALDGLRVNDRRALALVDAWVDAAAHIAGPHAREIAAALLPVVARFRNALRAVNTSRKSCAAPRGARRAVTAAIDRICDAYLAVDADSGRIVDANPAAAALLGVARDALIDVEATHFMPADSQSGWWTHFDAVTEGSEPQRFSARLADKAGSPISVECTLTTLATRNRTLALVVARPA
jgi:PAS domain S-box-containing protein